MSRRAGAPARRGLTRANPLSPGRNVMSSPSLQKSFGPTPGGGVGPGVLRGAEF